MQGAVERIVRAPVVDDGRGPVDLQQIARPDRFRQPHNIVIVGKEMMIELLQRPLPACPPLETGRQSTQFRPILEDMHLRIARARQLIGRGKPSDPAANDADPNCSLSLRTHQRSALS